MADVSVRDVAPGDARAIAEVQARTWRHAYAHIFPAELLAALSVGERARWWRRTIEERPPRTHTLVVDGEGGIAGFASVGPARAEPGKGLGELYAIYVLPGDWGRGLGRALLAEGLSRLREEGFGEAILWVFEDNPRSRRFYELAGWRLDGGVKDEDWLETDVRELRYRIPLDTPAE